jgi:hypothetical protein
MGLQSGAGFNSRSVAVGWKLAASTVRASGEIRAARCVHAEAASLVVFVAATLLLL